MHAGIVKMKAITHNVMWWSKKEAVSKCDSWGDREVCHHYSWPWASHPVQRIHIVFALNEYGAVSGANNN